MGELFDWREGRRRADEGAQRASDAADDSWKDNARAALARLAGLGEPFTTDDIWRIVGACPSGDPRALGAIVQSAHRSGSIKPTGRYVASERAACHRNPKREWVGADED